MDDNTFYRPDMDLCRENAKCIETVWCETEHFYEETLNILRSSSDTITTLLLPYTNQLVDLSKCRSLEALTIPNARVNYLDLSKCKQLKYVDISYSLLTTNISLDQLHTCTLLDYNWNTIGNIVECLSKSNSELKKIILDNCFFSVR